MSEEKKEQNPVILDVKEWLRLPGCKEHSYVIAKVTADAHDGMCLFRLHDGQHTVDFNVGLYGGETYDRSIEVARRVRDILDQFANALQEAQLRHTEGNEKYWRTQYNKVSNQAAAMPTADPLDEIFAEREVDVPQAAPSVASTITGPPTD